MSGYNYFDGMQNTNSYTTLGTYQSGECGTRCTDRFNEERSVKDRYYYDVFVLGKKVPPFYEIPKKQEKDDK